MNRGGIIAGALATAGWAPKSICSIEAEDNQGGGGGGSDAGGAAAALAAAAAGGGDGAADEFLKLFSADGGSADKPAPRDYIRGLGVKDLDALANLTRENQSAARNGGIKVPGADVKPEEIAAFHKAIGVPEAADKYAFDLPEGVSEEQLDTDMIGPLREVALKAGVPQGGFKALAEGVIKHQLDQMAADRKAEDDAYAEKEKEWGGQKDSKMANVQSAMRMLGLGAADFAAIQRGFQIEYREPGSGRALDLFQKLGAGMAEADFLDGGSKGRFGITGAEAQRELDTMNSDPEIGKKVMAGDPATVARRDRLMAAVAADRDRKTREASAP